MEIQEYKKDVIIERSKGKSNTGVTYYVRPNKKCFNRSRPVIIYDGADVDKRIKRLVVRWFWPMKYYTIDGITIGSNSESNALQEYWRVCDPSKKDKFLKATELTNYNP